MKMARTFIMPGQIISGQGALEEAIEEFAKMGTKALIVTDTMMVKLNNVEKVTSVLAQREIQYVIYDQINGEPTDKMIESGLALYEHDNCDFIVAIGGGSPIDAMKAIGALVTNKGKITDFMGKVIKKETPPLVAIPTTAGTGSEATQFTIITDTQKDVKMLLKGPALMPNLAIIDPQFTLTAPKKITAATGLDALTHAIEAYTSKKIQGLSDIFAMAAVKRIFTYLPLAYEDGEDVEAREQMSLAALEAGIAFNNSSVTIVHGMSRPIGAMFHVPHGLSNAMLLKDCLAFVLDGAKERFAKLGLAIGVASEEDSLTIASEKFLQAVEQLCSRLETPTLMEYGINREEFLGLVDKMAGDAMESGSPQNSRKQVSKEDVIGIYKGLV